MPGTVSDVSYLLKNMYMDNKTIEQWAAATLLYQLFKRDSKFVKGTAKDQGFLWPIEDERNTRGGAFPLSGSNAMKFIPPGGRTGTQGSSTLKGTEIGVIFDDILFEAAKDSDQAFYNVTKRNMSTLFEDAKNQDSRMLWGDGSGVLGTVGSINGNVITLADTGMRFSPLTLFLRPGQLVTFLHSNYDTIANYAGISIVASDDVNGQIEIDDASGLVEGDVIVMYLAHDAGSTTGNEPTGLISMFGNTSSLFNIDPDDYPRWVPGYLSSTPTDPTTQLFRQMFTGIRTKGGDSSKKSLISHPTVQDKYGLSFEQLQRIVNSSEIPAGLKISGDLNALKGLEIADIGTLYADLNTPQGTEPNTFYLWMGNPDKMAIEQAGDMHWFEQSGQVLWPLIGSAAVGSETVARWVAYAVHYWEPILFKRNSGGLHTAVNCLTVPAA